MARNPEAINQELAGYLQPQARGRLLARGLARGMVWNDGVVPAGGPEFSPNLTDDLLDFGYGVLALALELRDANRGRAPEQSFETDEAFRVAAESIESAVRRGNPNAHDQGRHLVVGAAAFHLAGYAARSFSLLPTPALNKNLASHEKALGLLLRRDLLALRDHVVQWLADPTHGDERVASRLLDAADEFGPEDAALLALGTSYHRGVGLADTALLFGVVPMFEFAVQTMQSVVTFAARIGNVPTWWAATLTLHLIRDLWDHSLHQRLPSGPNPLLPERWQNLRRDFIALLGTRIPPHIALWPSQLSAASRAVDPNDDLVIALPTSAGKTRIAEFCILRALAAGKRTVYVTPLRSLSAQVERVLARTFVPLGATVTSLYGASGATTVDASALTSADIVVATPEKLDFALRQDAQVLADVALVVLDEGHMIGLGSREVRYEVLIQRLLRRSDAHDRRIVCLSAMFNPGDPYFKDFGNWLRADAEGGFVHIRWRPTRQRIATLDWRARTSTAILSFLDGEKPFVPRFLEGKAPRRGRRNLFPQDEVEFCICAANAFARDGHSVLVYSPQRSQVEPLAREFRRISDQGYLSHVKVPQPEDLAVARAIGREWLGENHPAMRALEIGVGCHHGALPRPFLSAVEMLLDGRRLSIVVASPTLAQGIDLACSVLIFRSLRRYEKGKWVPISPAEFGNVVGRVGRAFVDLDGITVLPTFEAGDLQRQHALFDRLAQESQGQRLQSGLVLLIREIAELIRSKIGGSEETFLEYVMNQRDLWTDSRLAEVPTGDEEETEGEQSLERHLADLDVAIFSLIDRLDAPVEELAGLLDEVLNSSLWSRTLAHLHEPQRRIQRELLRSRTEWLWRGTTTVQREACYYAGLGRGPGLFLQNQLDTLVDWLSKFQTAIVLNDQDQSADAAVSLAGLLMTEPFFATRRLPRNWESVLRSWVTGTAFAEILQGRTARDAQKVQEFVQNGVVFRLVWAVEAVRVQAVAANHPRISELGDGPAFVLTYGVPRISAALLCQMGCSSRVGATWVARMLSASFNHVDGLRHWLREYEAVLSKSDFWESADHYLLWGNAFASQDGRPERWTHKTYSVAVDWKYASPPAQGSRVRVLSGYSRSAMICGVDLTPLGTAVLPFSPTEVALDAIASGGRNIEVAYFGRG